VVVATPYVITLATQDIQQKVPYIFKDALAQMTRDHIAKSKRQQRDIFNFHIRDPGDPHFFVFTMIHGGSLASWKRASYDSQ
jgi:hypothetical protein